MGFNGKNTNEQKQKMFLAMDLLKIIYTMAEQGEDYSLILRNYNDLIEEYGDYKIEKAVDNKKRKCYCNELDLYFESCNVADDYCRNILGIKIRGCGDVCKGKRKQSGKYNGESLHWNFVDNLYDEYKYIDRKKYNELISKNVNVCK